MVSDEIMELLLEEQEVPLDLIHKTIREGDDRPADLPGADRLGLQEQGRAAAARRGHRYLPSPLDREIFAKDNNNGMAEVPLAADPDAPLVAMAFKLVEEPFGQVTYMRIYQGTLDEGRRSTSTARQRKKAPDQPDPPRPRRPEGRHRLGRRRRHRRRHGHRVRHRRHLLRRRDERLAREHLRRRAGHRPVDPARPSGPTTTSSRKALNRFMREDPTFRVHVDHETSETIISGMGELHLEIYVERIRREYKVECTVGCPKVSYREAPTKRDAVQLQAQEADRRLGPVRPRRRPADPARPQTPPSRSSSRTRSPAAASRPSTSPRSRRASASRWHKGPVAGYEVIGVKMVLEDGSYHDVDSSTMAFEICARDCFRETFRKADPVLLEPIMKVEVEVPTEFQGPVTGAISSKRGVILGTESRSGFTVITGRGPARRDVRLLQRPPEHDPGQGDLQHGVPQVPEAPLAVPGRDRQEGPGRGQGDRQGLIARRIREH